MKSLSVRIQEKGLKKSFIAKSVGIAPATLSRIISGKQAYVSEELMTKINSLLE